MSVHFNTKEIIVQEDKNYRPGKDDKVSLELQGNTYAVVKHMKNKQYAHVRRIDKNHYKVHMTGEIKEYQPMTAKERENVRRGNMKRAFKELTGLLRTNFTGAWGYGQESTEHNQKFITLTYRDRVTDEKIVYRDFKNFMDRLEYEYPHDYTYISVVEPHASGVWHIHLMLKANDVAPDVGFWIKKEKLTKIWGHGATTILELKSNDIGAYYTAYFTGVFGGFDETKMNSEEILESEQALDAAVDAFGRMTGKVLTERQKEKKKAHIKGARMSFYPKGMRFFRCSRNVKRQEKIELDGDYSGVVNLYLDNEKYDEIYKKSYRIDEKTVNDEGEIKIKNLNRVYEATYRKKTWEDRQ
jgi:hypothetical protein